MKILNFKTDGLPEGSVYIGRRMARYGLPGSPLANPFPVDQWKISPALGRAVAIRKYEEWLRLMVMDANLGVTEALDSLTEDSTLVCWCKRPGEDVPCHGDIIEKIWRERQSTRDQP